LAIILDVVATVMAKATDGFTRPSLTAFVIFCVIASMYAFALCLGTLNLSMAYAVWTGMDFIALTALGWWLYGQRLDAGAISGILIIFAGIMVMNFFSSTMEVQH
jgi:small multidrug resistance pump